MHTKRQGQGHGQQVTCKSGCNEQLTWNALEVFNGFLLNIRFSKTNTLLLHTNKLPCDRRHFKLPFMECSCHGNMLYNHIGLWQYTFKRYQMPRGSPFNVQFAGFPSENNIVHLGLSKCQGNVIEQKYGIIIANYKCILKAINHKYSLADGFPLGRPYFFRQLWLNTSDASFTHSLLHLQTEARSNIAFLSS